jgi:hypothetical protein
MLTLEFWHSYFYLSVNRFHNLIAIDLAAFAKRIGGVFLETLNELKQEKLKRRPGRNS